MTYDWLKFSTLHSWRHGKTK